MASAKVGVVVVPAGLVAPVRFGARLPLSVFCPGAAGAKTLVTLSGRGCGHARELASPGGTVLGPESLICRQSNICLTGLLDQITEPLVGSRACVEGRKQAPFELGRLRCSHQAHRPGPRESHLNSRDDPRGPGGKDIDGVRKVHRLTDIVGDQ